MDSFAAAGWLARTSNTLAGRARTLNLLSCVRQRARLCGWPAKKRARNLRSLKGGCAIISWFCSGNSDLPIAGRMPANRRQGCRRSYFLVFILRVPCEARAFLSRCAPSPGGDHRIIGARSFEKEVMEKDEKKYSS